MVLPQMHLRCFVFDMIPFSAHVWDIRIVQVCMRYKARGFGGSCALPAIRVL